MTQPGLLDGQPRFDKPITDHAVPIQRTVQPAKDNVLSGSADVSSLTDSTDQVKGTVGVALCVWSSSVVMQVMPEVRRDARR